MSKDDFKTRILRSTVIAGFAATGLAMSPAFAQDDTDENTDEQDVVVVTGSRIARDEFSSSSPVQVITREEATIAGLTGLDDILQDSTIAMGSTQINDFFAGFVTDGGPGTNTVSLRGLGATRTLVLLNGRRLNPAGTRGTVAAVDLNVIPSAIVQRVEILKDGASSVYGSDAVAGVVNIITNSEFDGVTLNASTSHTFEGGGNVYGFNASMGEQFDRGSFLATVSYEEYQELTAGDRPNWALCQEQRYFDDAGNRTDVIDPATGEFKCFNTPIYAIDRETNTRYTPDPTASDDGFAGWRNVQTSLAGRRWFANGIEETASIIQPSRRLSFATFADYQLTPSIEAYSEVLFTNRNSSSNGLRQFFPDIPGDHPGNPFGHRATALTPVESDSSQEVNTLRTLVGLRGDLSVFGDFFSEWNWDVYYSYGHSNGRYGYDIWNSEHVEDAIDLVETSPGVYDCRVNVEGNRGAEGSRACVPWLDPFNPAFLDGYIDPAARAYMQTYEYGTTTFDQHLFNGYISGPLFQLPAGPLGVALGFEWRKDTIDDQPGPASAGGFSWGFTRAGRTAGDDEVSEIYAEFDIPLLSGAPLARSLDLNISARTTEYESGHSGETWKVGLYWQPIEQVTLRATQGTSFRAPALYELYLGGQTSFYSGSDPCDTSTGALTPVVAANCAADGLDTTPLTGFQGYNNTPETVTLGNGTGRLEAETSTATTIGLVVQPDWDLPVLNLLDGLSVAVEYFRYDIEDQVNRLGASGILTQCYQDPLFRTPGTICDFVPERDAVGNFNGRLNDSYFNISTQVQDGFDVTLRYQRELPFADMVVNWSTTFTEMDEFRLTEDSVPVDNNGTIGDPSHVSQLDFSFYRGDATYYFGVNYIPKMSDNSLYGLNVADYGYDVVTEAYTTFDGSVRYDADDWSLTVGIRNLLDEQPPTVSYEYSSTQGSAAFATQFDRRGRTAFIDITKNF